MLIDVHAHLGRTAALEGPPVTEDELLRRMDEWGVGRAVIQPLVSPEGMGSPYTTEHALEAVARHPDRLLTFCNIDPRMGHNRADYDFGWMLGEYKAAGCLGLGEMTCNLWFDDPRCLNLYRQCGEVGFPVLFDMHGDVREGLYGVADDLGLPRLERTLAHLPETVFIGHAPAFWAEIASNVSDETRDGYPGDPIERPGRVPELLRAYPNLWADISAGSGYNALTRSPEYGYRFLEEFQDKLLFGTDICVTNQDIPIVAWLEEARGSGRITEACYRKVGWENAQRLLGLA